MRELLRAALDAAADGTSYADVRGAEVDSESLSVTGESVEALDTSVSIGFGVRVLVDGAWGYAASSTLTQAEAVRVRAPCGGSCACQRAGGAATRGARSRAGSRRYVVDTARTRSIRSVAGREGRTPVGSGTGDAGSPRHPCRPRNDGPDPPTDPLPFVGRVRHRANRGAHGGRVGSDRGERRRCSDAFLSRIFPRSL